MFITRTGDEEAFIDARRCLRNVTPANGFFVFLRACDARGVRQCPRFFRATLGKICRPGY
ncbi:MULTISPECIES: hypothetical protein [unclassified Bradyrhizobium]|uniref:hypothetical protein n=1 Tax=unclassified Bradyrhizobium TaxID=2631580 RepID=UPI0028EA26E9|nr:MULTISPECIES: hypothetical protein [unclassified Bradyrhizobium]